jgi:hypothetical protein
LFLTQRWRLVHKDRRMSFFPTLPDPYGHTISHLPLPIHLHPFAIIHPPSSMSFSPHIHKKINAKAPGPGKAAKRVHFAPFRLTGRLGVVSLTCDHFGPAAKLLLTRRAYFAALPHASTSM